MKNRLQNKLITKGSIWAKVAAYTSDLFQGEIWQDYRTEPEYIKILSSSSNANQPAELFFPCTLLTSKINWFLDKTNHALLTLNQFN